jgi:hypothetical protein
MKKDWGSLWFELREEKGQSDLTTVMYRDSLNGPLIPEHFRHRESDGFGKMQSVLRKSGFEVRPSSKKLTPPAAWKFLPLLIKGILKHPVCKHNPWREYRSKPSEAPDRVSNLQLTDEESSKLVTKAKALHVSVAYYLMSVLTEKIRLALYRNPNDEAVWLFPVDLRGAFPDAALETLTLSFVPIHIRGPALADLPRGYGELRAKLKAGEYWAYHALYNIGRLIGRRGMKYLVDRTHEKSFWMGSFSDLGSWNQPELCNSPIKDRIWYLAPPGSPSYPIGFSHIEWCGRRTLNLRIHPSVTSEDTVLLAARLLEELRAEIQRE